MIVISGNITFLEEVADGEFSAIIHSVNAIIDTDTLEQAIELGKKLLDSAENYLIFEDHKGEVKWDMTPYEVNEIKKFINYIKQ